MPLIFFCVLFFRINELEGVDGCRVLEKAVASSPMKPELYYLSARLELSRTANIVESEKCISRSCSVECRGRSYHINKAVELLSGCVKVFYSTSDAVDTSVAQVLTLYRYVPAFWLVFCANYAFIDL